MGGTGAGLIVMGVVVLGAAGVQILVAFFHWLVYSSSGASGLATFSCSFVALYIGAGQ